jgi:uncharacterized protein
VAAAAPITCLLFKVASRCNLACDYCYVYEHADQSWRDQPYRISDEVVTALADRVSEYVATIDLDRLSVVFHGGEPLLAGADRLAATAQQLQAAAGATCTLDVSLQTNGVLLNDAALTTLADAGIAISLSLDGPREANDRHRLTRSGRSSFEDTLRALELLKTRPDVFTGVIAVIDPDVDATDLFEFFDNHRPPRLDFLLPDANHVVPPPGRELDAGRYQRWLIAAFDLWFDVYPHLPVRTFDAILAAVTGKPSGTDAFGFGDVTLLTVETDGSYHDLDVLKVTTAGTALDGNVFDTSIVDAARSDRLAAHRNLLTIDGLSDVCRACPEVAICGGGAVPHRFSTDGFSHPSVYCEELKSLIGHARQRLRAALRDSPSPRASSTDMDAYAGSGQPDHQALQPLLAVWRRHASDQLIAALGGTELQSWATTLAPETLQRIATLPSVQLWLRVTEAAANGVELRALDGRVISADRDYARELPGFVSEARSWPAIHRNDRWLRRPFTAPISFLEDGEAAAAHDIVTIALQTVDDYSAALRDEMTELSSEIQLIRDGSAGADKFVSFSDDIVPGALFIGPYAGADLISPADAADALIHEHRHQKLYLLQRDTPLVERDRPPVRSPWRDDPRPPSGLLHAVFVFVELRSFWVWVETQPELAPPSKAHATVELIERRLEEAWPTLAACALTNAGHELVAALRQRAER